MGKKLIIKGADFSVNGISGGDVPKYVTIYQGLLNSVDSGSLGAVEATSSGVYAIRVYTSHTIAVPAGATIGFSQSSGLNIQVGGLLVYSRYITFNPATSSRDKTPVPYCIGATPYPSNPPTLNTYTYTNSSGSTVYVGLTLRKSDNSSFTPSDIGSIEVTLQ